MESMQINLKEKPKFEILKNSSSDLNHAKTINSNKKSGLPKIRHNFELFEGVGSEKQDNEVVSEEKEEDINFEEIKEINNSFQELEQFVDESNIIRKVCSYS